jgi:hypothetical protein
VKARRAEEDDGVLDALAAEASQRLGVFGEDADEAAVGAIEEGRIFVGQQGLLLNRVGRPAQGIPQGDPKIEQA